MNNKNIYLDHHATTPIDSRVLKAMLPYLTDYFGNPSTESEWGLAAKAAISQARQQVASLVNASPNEIYFTSGATESLNWAIRGLAEVAPPGKKHIITTSIEHSAVLKTCEFIGRYHGFEITVIAPDQEGIVNPAHIADAIRPETLLVIVMHANNEIGTIQPIGEIGRVCNTRGVFFLVDAAQSLGKIDCDVAVLNIDLLAASGHKLYAPKGIGFLYIRDRLKSHIHPLQYGGGQEGGFRSGTPNVPFIVALGEACQICAGSMKEEMSRIRSLRDQFIAELKRKIPDLIINGSLEHRLPGNINFSVKGVSNELLLENMEHISLSKGSACSAAKKTESHVLLSISKDENVIHSAIRVGIGRFNTQEEISTAAFSIASAIDAIRSSRKGY